MPESISKRTTAAILASKTGLDSSTSARVEEKFVRNDALLLPQLLACKCQFLS